MLEWYHRNQYQTRPSEALDPHWELNDSQRDYIDFAFMRKENSHVQRVRDILDGKVTIKNVRVAPIDKYPQPRKCDINLMAKTSGFVRKMMKDAGWK